MDDMAEELENLILRTDSQFVQGIGTLRNGKQPTPMHIRHFSEDRICLLVTA